MEIKSSLLNDKYFDELRKSLIEISKIDGKQDFRVRMLEYINDTADIYCLILMFINILLKM